MTQKKSVKKLIKLKTFLSAQRREIEAIQAPDDFVEQMQKLVADYDLRQQATVAEPLPADNTQPADKAPPVSSPQHKRQLKLLFRRRQFSLSPALAASVAMAALIICAIALTLPKGSSWTQHFVGLVEVKAAYAASNGIDVNEGFIISTSQPLPMELVEKSLQVYPEFDYQLQQQDESTYRVLPTTPLEQNKVYHLSFDPERVQEDKPVRAEYSWSFQTEAALTLLECSPTDTANEVPVAAALTLTFSEEIAPQATDFISLEPQLSGNWQIDGANLYFTPAQGWAYDTVYTVQLAEGLPAQDGSVLPQSQLSRFSTEPLPAEVFAFSLAEWALAGKTFTPQQTPSWLLTEEQESDDSPYLAALYALPDAPAYAAVLHEQWEGIFSIEGMPGLTLLEEYQLMPMEEQQGYRLTLPRSLLPGFYALHLSKQGYQQQLLFQVSSLSAYMAQGINDSLFWLHDGAGRPVYDAAVWRWPQGAESGRSDNDGVAVLPSVSQESGRLLYCLQTEQESLVLAVENTQASLLPLPCHSWALYTEQNQYRAGETVNFFGVYETRIAGEPVYEENPRQLSLRLKAMGANAQALPYTVAVESGAFSGSLLLPGLRPGWYELAIYNEENYVGGSFIQVVDSEEPLWQIKLQPMSAVAMVGQRLEWQAQALYNGQPLSQVVVKLEDTELGGVTQGITDEDGYARISLPLLAADGQTPYASREFRASAVFPNQQVVEAKSSVRVLQYDAFVDAAAIAVDETSWQLQLTPYSLSLPEYGMEAVRGDFSGMMTLHGTLLGQETEQLSQQPSIEEEAAMAGEDIEKTPEQPVTQEFTWELSGSRTQVHTITVPQPGAYRLLLRGTDSAGRSFELELALPTEQNQPLLLQDAYTATGQEQHYYAPDEAVELSLYRGQAILQPTSGSSGLFVLAGDNIMAHSVTYDGSASLQAQNAYPAVFHGWAVYYQDGRYYESAALPLYGLQQPAAQLQVDWQTVDEEVQSTIRLSLSLSDAAGQPLAGTLNLNLFSQQPQEEDGFALALNGREQPFMYRHTVSYENSAMPKMMPDTQKQAPENQPDVTEQGSGLFVTLTTDALGQAELEFTLPQQSREWFLGWRAYNGQRNIAASGITQLDLRLPLSLEYMFGESSMYGDAPTVRLLAAGSAVQPGESVTYELSIPALAYQHSVKAKVGQWYKVGLPALPLGSYELRLTAVSGSLRIARSLPFTVRQELSGSYTLQQQQLQASTKLNIDSQQNITLVFSDSYRAGNLAALFSLAKQDALRLDYKLSSLAATGLLRQYTGWENADNEVGGLMLYQRESGGLAPLPHSAVSNKLSALAAPLVAEGIDNAALVAHLRSYYEQSTQQEECALALYGLASLEQPVLLDIDRMMAEQPTQQTQLYLALAYMACGNGAAAKALSVDLLAEHMQQDADGLMYADGFTDTEDATAHLALLAQTFELPQAEGLYTALLADNTPGYAQNLAKAQILAARCRALPPNAYFSYQLAGDLRQVSLREHGFYSLTLTAQQLAELSFSDLAGSVELSVISYQQGWPVAKTGMEQPLSLERSYQQQDESIILSEYGLAEIHLDFYLPQEAPAGYYRIVDTLPAGLRFYALDQEASSRQVRLFAQDGDTVSFDVYKGNDAYYGSVVYTAWVYTPGVYQAVEPRLYGLSQPEFSALGKAQQVEIR